MTEGVKNISLDTPITKDIYGNVPTAFKTSGKADHRCSVILAQPRPTNDTHTARDLWIQQTNDCTANLQVISRICTG